MIARIVLLTLAVLPLVGGGTMAQESASDRHAMATNLLRQAASDISERCLKDVQTLKDWEARRPAIKQQLLWMLGLDPLPTKSPLNPNITGTLDRERYRIEKIVFQSMPGLFVTGNFYVPKGAAKPLPTVLYLCGHAPHPAGAKFNYQDRAAWFASHGFACLILDTLEFGEVPGIHHGTHDLNMWHWLSLGYTPAGTEVWNAMRAIDYLETRPEVDRGRIGLTGISGGGAITWYTAAVEERVAAAAPVCSTYTFGSQATHWRAAGQCDCIYYPNSRYQDFPIVGALIAPRPLLMISGRKDGDFPPDGYHEVFSRSKKIYDLYAGGDSDRVREFDDEVGHSDPPQFRRAAQEWMKKWLEAPGIGPDEIRMESAEDLAVLKQLPPGAINYTIQNQLTRPVTPRSPVSAKAWEKRRSELVTTLRSNVFGWFPNESIPFETKISRNTGGWTARYADYKEITFQTERGARIRGQLLKPKKSGPETPVVVYIKRPGDSIYFMDFDELLPVLGRYIVLILNARFAEQQITAFEHAGIEMTAAWSGRTVASMQTWDLLRTVAWIFEEEKLRPSSISVFGKGQTGVLGLYAALFDERIDQVILHAPPGSHWEGPALLNVLRVTDLAEVAGALAPRSLILTSKSPTSFALTKKIYALKKASGKLKETGSLPEALEVWKR